MKKMLKKVLALVLAVMMVIAALPMTVAAVIPESGTCGNNLTWTLKDKVLTISGTGAMDNFNMNGKPWQDPSYGQAINSIEKVIIKEGVTTIGSHAFSNFTDLEEITLPRSLKSIGNSAFYLSNLTTITIPDGVTDIKDSAFDCCYFLTSIKIPDSVTSLGQYAFFKCYNLTTVILGSGISKLMYKTFDECTSLTTVYISKSMIDVGKFAFDTCPKLSDVYYEGTEQDWKNINFALYNTELTGATRHYKSCPENEDFVHDYNTVVTNVTCTKQGYTTYTCECGDTYVADYIEPTGHKHTSEITTPATHITEGVITYTCVCGDTYTEIIAKSIDHTYDAVVTKPSCTEDGLSIYTCECGDAYLEEIPAIGHNVIIVSGVDATCIKSGLTDGRYCSVCDEVLSVQEEIPALGHDWSEGAICGNCSIMRGDMTGDNCVNSNDAIQLLYYTLLPERYEVNQNCDFNGDGFVDSNDAIYLLYHTLIPERYPLA